MGNSGGNLDGYLEGHLGGNLGDNLRGNLGGYSGRHREGKGHQAQGQASGCEATTNLDELERFRSNYIYHTKRGSGSLRGNGTEKPEFIWVLF